MDWKSKIDARLGVKLVAAVLIAVLSFWVLAERAKNPQFYGGTVEALEEKQEDVLGITAGLAVAATGIAAIPSDATTPIANQLMQLTDWMLVVLCVVFLEKYLLTLLGFAAFKIIIPIGCILYLADVFSGRRVFRSLCKKLAVLGIVFVFAIPTGIGVSEMIDTTYQMSLENAEAGSADALIETMEEEEQAEGALAGFFDKVKNSAVGLAEKAKEVLNGFIERVAVMVVTSCLIPVGVLLFLIWIVKTVIGAELPALPQKRIAIGRGDSDRAKKQETEK